MKAGDKIGREVSAAMKEKLNSAMGKVLCRAGRGKWRAATLLALLAFGINVTVSLIAGLPYPKIHDEFSYLLAGDTFAHGRLSNPTHPLCIHFETIHVIQQPVYASKYMPGQGLILAAGQVMSGQPIVGVWLCASLLAMIVYWMLLAWMPPRWAFLGALLTTAHPTVATWGQGYWGGTLAMCGGALLTGAAQRIARRRNYRSAWLAGVGIAVLAFTRPYEGGVLSALIATGLVLHEARAVERKFKALFINAALPAAAILIPSLMLLGYYNLKVTGDAFTLPYFMHESSYGVAPVFIWGKPLRQPSYRHEAIKEFHLKSELKQYKNQASFSGKVIGFIDKISKLLIGYCEFIPFGIPLLALPWLLKRGSRVRAESVVLALFLVFLMPETYMHTHYCAPAFGLLIVLSMQGLRLIRLQRRWGMGLSRRLIPLSLLLALACFVPLCARLMTANAKSVGAKRAQVAQSLARSDGKHLVLVRYVGEKDIHQEWVYNGAEIDDSEVVWAREMDEARNATLLDYFGDRNAWLLEVRTDVFSLKPYPRGQESSSLPIITVFPERRDHGLEKHDP